MPHEALAERRHAGGGQGVNCRHVGHVLDLPHPMRVGLVEASRVEVLAHHR